MCRQLFRFLIIIAFATCTSAAGQTGIALQSMSVERLPDLNVPRSGHALVVANGELTVIGGHTGGFLLTNTAEYFKDGSWHKVESLYPHDFGACAQLLSGEVLMAGGCAEAFGIGRSFGVERYDPVTHSFTSLPILDVRRARCTAALQSDGTLLVSGNWYDDDAVGRYDPASGGVVIQPVTQGRSNPYILQTAPDNAIILSSCGNHTGQDILERIVVDPLRGEPLEEPLLQEWRPLTRESSFFMNDYFIGDEALGGYAWLIPATGEDGCTGILKLVGEAFTLLETADPIPMQDPDGNAIVWSGFHADRTSGQCYLISTVQPSGRIYVCKVGYGEALRAGKAPLALYCADVRRTAGALVSALLPGGRIAVVGGSGDDNYHPVADAFILHTESRDRASFVWWGIGAGALILAGVVVMAVRAMRRRRQAAEALAGDSSESSTETRMNELMARITAQMEEGHLFLKAGLTKEDVARAVSSNSRYVSDCINAVVGCSFIDFVNGYRIRYAQRLLFENPDMRLSEISEESGFSSDVTFYRNFKARTGQTPGEWLASQSQP